MRPCLASIVEPSGMAVVAPRANHSVDRGRWMRILPLTVRITTVFSTSAVGTAAAVGVGLGVAVEVGVAACGAAIVKRWGAESLVLPSESAARSVKRYWPAGRPL